MKLLFFLIFSTIGFAQVTTVYQGDNRFTPEAIINYEDYLYVASSAGSIERISLSNPLIIETVIELASINPGGIAILNDYLYFGTELGGTSIYRVNLNAPFPIDLSQADQVAILIDRPTGLAFKNNELFIAERNRIVKIDLTEDVFPIPKIPIVDVYYATDLTFKGNDLYMATTGDAVYKFNTLDASPTLELITDSVPNTFGLEFVGDNLLISQSDNKITVVNITSAIPLTPTIYVDSIHLPYGLAKFGDDVYICQRFDNRISKISISPLSIDHIDDLITIIYPNPSSERIFLKNNSKEMTYNIYDELSRNIKSGHVTNKGIVVSDLSSGIYIIRFGESNVPYRFIKI